MLVDALLGAPIYVVHSVFATNCALRGICRNGRTGETRTRLIIDETVLPRVSSGIYSLQTRWRVFDFLYCHLQLRYAVRCDRCDPH